MLVANPEESNRKLTVVEPPASEVAPAFSETDAASYGVRWVEYLHLSDIPLSSWFLHE
jgi:hypothetical protein